MTERSKRFLYRLYGLAECAYYQQISMMKEEVRPSKIWRVEPSIIVNEEPEDNNSDQWKMFQKDYNMIR